MTTIGVAFTLGRNPSAASMLVPETTLNRAFKTLVVTLVIYVGCASSAAVPFTLSSDPQSSFGAESMFRDNLAYSRDDSSRDSNVVVVKPPEHPLGPNGIITSTTIITSTIQTATESSNEPINTTTAVILPSAGPTSSSRLTQTFQPTLPFPLVITVQPPTSMASPSPSFLTSSNPLTSYTFTTPPSQTNPIQTLISTITQPASTVTVQLPPATITSFVTVTSTDAYTYTVSISMTPTTIVPTVTPTEWSLPAQFTSLDDAFEIAHFAYGRENMQLVTADSVNIPDILGFSGLTADVYSGPDIGADAGTNESIVGLDFARRSTSRTILQLQYPAGSYSPSHQPRGGADFYSSPSESHTENISTSTNNRVDWKSANNVTLTYAVYFPPDFDFVRGGKLPGLYGGHEKCSGGDDGLGCFSTRLMWRSSGKGELYLYAPKDRQPASLCSTPPLSVCDSTYGLSIGRGSFTFPRGEWFWVRQTVWLNTPGVADGGFVLEVGNSEGSMSVVLNSAEVFYRDRGGEEANDGNSDVNGQMIVDDIYGEDDEPTYAYPTYPDDEFRQDAQAILQQEQQRFGASNNPSGPPLLYLHHSREQIISDTTMKTTLVTPVATDESTTPVNVIHSDYPYPTAHIPASTKIYVYAVEGTTTVTMPNYQTNTVLIPVPAPTQPTQPTQRTQRGEMERKSLASDRISFIGIFFSTFFGGSTLDWASPRDQNVWFGSFTVRINA